jgi:hypothetical protein
MARKMSSFQSLLVRRDVERVMRHAYAVIVLDQDGNFDVRLNQSDKPGLSVVAVVGPGDYHGRHYDQAVLFEIGKCRGRPYAQANRALDSFAPGEARQIPKRRKWFSLTDKQYLAVAPQIIRMISDLTEEKMAGREWGTRANPTYVKVTTSYWRRRGKGYYLRTKYVPLVTGVRFSVAYADLRLFADVLWAERNLNKETRKTIARRARYVRYLVSRYLQKARPESNFWKSEQGVAINDVIIRARSLPHLQIDLMEELARLAKQKKEKGKLKERTLFRQYLEEVNERFGHPNRIFVQAMRASLPHHANRVGNILLRAIRANHRYLTFEVMPQAVKSSTAKQPPCPQEEIPF